MMNTATALLSLVLDSDGYIVVRGLKPGRPPTQKYFSPGDVDGAVEEAHQLDARGYDAYFSTSTFQTTTSAAAANAQSVKCFKLDLDVDPDDPKKYPSKSAAVAACLSWCEQNGVPYPILVDSGYGVHAYWALSSALDRTAATLYAAKFKAVTVATHLKCDPTVTADIARILRVPGTRNYKREKPRPVTLRDTGALGVHDTTAFCALVDRLYVDADGRELAPSDGFSLGNLPDHLKGEKLDRNTLGLLEGKPKKFAIILRKAMEGHGCAHIRHAYTQQDTLDEPHWRSALSVAKFCDDGADAIHMISNGHPDYDPHATARKAEGIVGPHTCRTFEALGPQLCNGCEHQGKITSPIQLGDYVPVADKSEALVMGRNASIEDEAKAYEIPEYPWPYFRAAGGGVWRQEKDDPDNENATLVYPRDLYVVRHLRDELAGYIVQLRLHTEKDGVLDFILHTSDLGKLESFREILNRNGIMVFDKTVLIVRDYVQKWFEMLKAREEVAMVKNQFGWSDNFKSFILGEKEIDDVGYSFSPTAPSLGHVAKFFKGKGELEEWKKLINIYGRPGLETQAFCALTAFGGPLLTFTQVKGAMINAFSQASGAGKSTTLRICNSVWGHPDDLMLHRTDTNMARFHRLGIHKNIPFCIDELTMMRPEDVANLVFDLTNGKGRERMEASANTTRVNNTTWNTITLASANRSFTELLMTSKELADGQLMRLVELEVMESDLIPKEQADELFRPLTEHYGLAGEIYARYLINHLPRVKAMLDAEQKRFDRDGKITNKERFWSAIMVCNYVGGILAKEAGLHDIDMDRIYQHMLQWLEKMRARINFTTDKQQRDDILGEFLNVHNANILTVKSNTANNTVTVMGNAPTNQLHVRYEMDEHKVYISQPEFRKFCASKNIALENYIREQKAKGILLDDGHVQKRLGAGTSFPSSPVRVFVFNLDIDQQ